MIERVIVADEVDGATISVGAKGLKQDGKDTGWLGVRILIEQQSGLVPKFDMVLSVGLAEKLAKALAEKADTIGGENARAAEARNAKRRAEMEMEELRRRNATKHKSVWSGLRRTYWPKKDDG